MHSIFSMVRFEVALCVFLSARQTAAHCSYATDTDSNSGTDKATGNREQAQPALPGIRL